MILGLSGAIFMILTQVVIIIASYVDIHPLVSNTFGNLAYFCWVSYFWMKENGLLGDEAKSKRANVRMKMIACSLILVSFIVSSLESLIPNFPDFNLTSLRLAASLIFTISTTNTPPSPELGNAFAGSLILLASGLVGAFAPIKEKSKVVKGDPLAPIEGENKVVMGNPLAPIKEESKVVQTAESKKAPVKGDPLALICAMLCLGRYVTIAESQSK